MPAAELENPTANWETLTANWKPQPRRLAKKLVKQYGEPDEMTTARMIWHQKGEWKRIELIDEEIPHNFPGPHVDSLLQVISYRLPAGVANKISDFDGSIIIERTRGELAVRCEDEGANFLALNLVNEIISGQKSIAEARMFYAEALENGKYREYREGLLFPRTATDPADPDFPVEQF